MLVLSRKKNESIIIGENIVVTVVEVRGDKYGLVSTHRRKSRFIVKKSTKRLSVAKFQEQRTPLSRRRLPPSLRHPFRPFLSCWHCQQFSGKLNKAPGFDFLTVYGIFSVSAEARARSAFCFLNVSRPRGEQP